jgi:hypothetical protein
MMGLMNKISTASGRKGAFAILLPFCALVFGAMAPALAKQCPRGEYLRVSKGICVPKSEAHTRLGSGSRRGVGGLSAPAGMELIHSEASTAYATVKGPTNADAADDVVKAKTATKADSTVSPYGALDLQSFSRK